MHETLEFVSQHGLMVLAATVFAEQIGLPLPAMPFLIAAGALVGTGQMAPGLAVVAAVVAAMAGDQVWFELGRRRGRLVLNWLCRISLEPTSCVRRTEDLFARHGVRALIVAKFVPGFSTIAPPLAGIVGLSVPQYLLFNGLGTLLWVGTGLGLGIMFSDQLEQALSMSVQIGPAVGLTLVAAVIGYVIYKAIHRYQADSLVPRVTVRQLVEQLSAGEAPMIIDLRSVGAREEQPGIPGAVAMALDELAGRQHDLPRDRALILYCDCPRDASSVEGARMLRKLGFTRVWPLHGGIEAWNTAAATGLPSVEAPGRQIAAVTVSAATLPSLLKERRDGTEDADTRASVLGAARNENRRLSRRHARRHRTAHAGISANDPWNESSG